MKRKRTPKRSRGVARGKMFLASRLGWLSGVPLSLTAEGIRWLAVPRFGDHSPQEMVITREHLARATRTWTKLVYRFPHALPQLVEDVDWWQTAVPELLDQLSQTIHHNAPLPAARWSEPAVREQAQTLIHTYPTLQPVINGFSWAIALYPQETTAALQWLHTHAAALQTIITHQPQQGLALVLSLWFLTTTEGEQRVTPLLNFLGNEVIYQRPLVGLDTHFQAWHKALDSYITKGQYLNNPPETPEPTTHHALQRLVNWLLSQNGAIRRRALDLWADLLPDNYLAAWDEWWTNTAQLLHRVRRVTSIYATAETKAEAETIKSQLNELQETLPAPLHIRTITTSVQQASSNPKLYGQIRPTLRQIPRQLENHLPRPTLLYHWLNLYERYGTPVISFISQFQKYLQHPLEPVHLLGPWDDILQNWHRANPQRYWGFDFYLFSDIPEQRLWPLIFETIALATAALGEPLSDDDLDTIGTLVKLTEQPELALAYFQEYVAADFRESYVSDDALRCAHLLNDPHQSQFAALLKIIDGANNWQVSQRVTDAVAVLEAAGWTHIGRVLVLDGELDTLQRAGQLYQTLQELGQEVHPPSPFPGGNDPLWLTRYPAVFHPALRLLHTLSPTAEAAAQRILGKNYPDPVQLQQEIDNLQAQLETQPDQPHLAKRIKNLRQRLRKPAQVSAVRSGRLEQKLHHAVQRAALNHWHTQLAAALRSHLATLLEINDPPAWLSEPAQLTILTPMLQLPNAFKQLGLRLLQVRCGPPPWNLLDDPANQAFIEKLEQLGLNTAAWLNPPPPQEMTAANGRTVIVSFEPDPLEIFHMGGHFNTCLSPGAFNFFSVFANAADINKQVVYARDPQGQVVGRCLLALTDQGGLLTFEPYCHDHELGFDNLMGEVAGKLTEQMGTIPVLNGTVSPLVASDWYDDGPRDLCGRFAFIAYQSPFRKSLPTLTAAQFMQQLQDGFDPLPLNGLTLTLVLSMWELNNAPHLIVPLLPHIEAHKNISDHLLLFAARLAYKAGETEATHRLLKDRAVPYLHRQFRNHGGLDMNLVHLLAELEPSAALRLLRQTRPQGVRRDEDDVGERRHILALAHENLGRAVRAQRLRAG